MLKLTKPKLLPTDLPKISANDKLIDNLFLLKDGTYAIVDYESVYKKTNKVKYLHYIARVMERYYKEDKNFTLRTEQAFLFHIDGEAVFQSVLEKFHSCSQLMDDDLMKLIILPLTVPGSEGKQRMLEKIVDLADQIPDEEQRVFAFSGVIVASDKFIDRNYLEQIRRRIDMTQLGQLYEKDKIEYANRKTREMALKMLAHKIDIVDIMEVTGLTEEELLRLQNANVTV